MNKVTRRLLIALLVSASINLFLIGFITARFVLGGEKTEPFGDEANPKGPVSLFGATEVLGNPKPMKELLRKHMKDFSPKRMELREARHRIARALAAEPFDPQTLRKELDSLRQATQDSQRAIHKALVDLAISLTPQQRRMLSKSPRLWQGKTGRRGPRHQKSFPHP